MDLAWKDRRMKQQHLRPTVYFSRMKARYWGVVLMVLGACAAFGQGKSVLPYTITVNGTITGEMTGEPLKGVKVRVLRDGELSNLIITKGNGRFKIELERNYFYAFEFTRDDLVDKHVTIDTRGAPPLLDVPSLTMIIDISLFTPVPGMDTQLFEEPMGKAVYKHSSRNIMWDLQYEQEIATSVRKFMAEYYKEVDRIGTSGSPAKPGTGPLN